MSKNGNGTQQGVRTFVTTWMCDGCGFERGFFACPTAGCVSKGMTATARPVKERDAATEVGRD